MGMRPPSGSTPVHDCSFQNVALPLRAAPAKIQAPPMHINQFFSIDTFRWVWYFVSDYFRGEWWYATQQTEIRDGGCLFWHVL